LNRSRCSFRLSGWRLCDWFFGSRFGRQLGSRLRWVLGYGLVCWLRQSFDCGLLYLLGYWFWLCYHFFGIRCWLIPNRTLLDLRMSFGCQFRSRFWYRFFRNRLRLTFNWRLFFWLRRRFGYRLWCLLRCCLGLRLRFWFWFWFNNRLRSGWGSLFGCWVSRRLC
jgi:hypothetical protein